MIFISHFSFICKMPLVWWVHCGQMVRCVTTKLGPYRIGCSWNWDSVPSVWFLHSWTQLKSLNVNISAWYCFHWKAMRQLNFGIFIQFSCKLCWNGWVDWVGVLIWLGYRWPGLHCVRRGPGFQRRMPFLTCILTNVFGILLESITL